ncbi:SdiA-regulated domain-containing protein [Hydrogenophaga sp.]|uniref:SdiA-regulated domain-containing protein n=1 Tax=Hydrogenophaga sp. TaxID=1904254 RepID=UPI0027233496|nr:SdiA-regulated domain-containing protein [Hydrogenophaga sp.]MDO9437805.1 SdiA-regulated domain-containing protein [Hydrogenophaga sp.]
MPRVKICKPCLWIALLCTTFLFFWYFKVLALGYYWVATSLNSAQGKVSALWLPDYRVAVEGLPIEGLTRNTSGLTFNEETGTLFTVINRPPQIAELTTDGRLLRVIEIDGVKDPEGITYVERGTYVISDEESHSMVWVKIGPDTRRVSVNGASRLGLSIDSVHNASFEGVSWDSATDRLFVVKEKMPLRVLVVSGLDVFNESTGFNINIHEWQSSSAASLFVSDLSSLTLHEPSGQLLLLSDESALIVAYAPDGRPISMLPLWRGFHGLRHKVPQPEGLAVGPDGAIYVLSEPNLFYRFERAAAPAAL